MTSYEQLIQGEQSGAHTIEIRELASYREIPYEGVANSTPQGTVQCYVGSDDGSDDCEISPEEFNERFEVTAVLIDDTKQEAEDEFDLPAYLLGEVYGPIADEEPLKWSLSDSEALASDLYREYGISTNPQEIYDLMIEFYQQDHEE